MKLQEVLEAATKDFTDRVKKILEDIKNKTATFILGVLAEYDEFHNHLKVESLKQSEELIAKIMENEGQEDFGE